MNSDNYYKEWNTNITMSIPPKLFSKDFNAIDIIIYGTIQNLAYKKGYCYASNEEIAKRCNQINKKTIQRSIKYLEEQNLITTRLKYSHYGRKRVVYLNENIQKINHNEEKINEEQIKKYEKVLNFDWLEND